MTSNSGVNGQVGENTMSSEAFRDDVESSVVESSAIQRVTVTKQYLIRQIVSGEATDLERTAFHDGICKLIYKMAGPYARQSRDDFDDLVNECWLRIFTYLPRYDSEKAKLTTWVWYLCRSVLNRNAELSKRHSQRMKHPLDLCSGVIEEDSRYDEFSGIACVQPLDDAKSLSIREACRDAVVCLWFNHVKQQDILIVLFGNPHVEGKFCLPDEICCRTIADRTGRDVRAVQLFINRKVKPYLRKHMSFVTDA